MKKSDLVKVIVDIRSIGIPDNAPMRLHNYDYLWGGASTFLTCDPSLYDFDPQTTGGFLVEDNTTGTALPHHLSFRVNNINSATTTGATLRLRSVVV